jgi:hypothetical protein
MTTTEKTPFPERMHKQSVDSHTRRAERALKELAYEVDALGRRLGNGSMEAEDPRRAAQLVTDLAAHFAALEALREVREWDEAERAGDPS